MTGPAIIASVKTGLAKTDRVNIAPVMIVLVMTVPAFSVRVRMNAKWAICRPSLSRLRHALWLPVRRRVLRRAQRRVLCVRRRAMTRRPGSIWRRYRPRLTMRLNRLVARMHPRPVAAVVRVGLLAKWAVTPDHLMPID
jgi:hypothetical protein